MKLFGVVGFPIGHSSSPAMMNAAFREQGEDAVYVPFAVKPEQFEQAFNGLAALGAVGVNVTIPHKVSAFNWVDQRTPEATSVGAVNTIRFSDDGAIGHNTDVSGWWRSVADHVPTGNPTIEIVGAGGAAMAVLAAISANRPNASVGVIARREEAVQALQHRFIDTIAIDFVPWDVRNEALANANVVIQTTPIGMWPRVDDSPVTDAGVFSPGQVVQDIIYRPRVTNFAKLAMDGGATVVDGLSMLVYQGVDAYEWWLGKKAPVESMFRAVEEHLGTERRES
ncbi:shikimate dehydrogenase [Alicyclobacillus dauci]|uniref:Shikimate dehydrogenase (NADP(+)) n=1 Tax=Alicyclobacillus dauci TaxID=1475485 RepID=A0ABY6Z6K2_9BACL|nr:shikimate dehydrogenase [Alicyclobacillus dauci]WAH38517.1 shikimate dehydrogenase [Alicyclobacillus dauci]